MVRYIVLEKQLKQKELMKMMSVLESDIGMSWFASFAGFHLLTSVVASAMTTQLYANSSFVLLLIFWIFTMIAIISFAFFIAAFFTNATRATLISLLIFFIGYFLTLVFDFQEDDQTYIALVSLHPVAAFGYGLQEIGRLEDLAVGLTVDTATNTDNASGYTFLNTLINLAVDCVFWGLLGWYANRVVPSEFGQPLPLYFPFTLSYWCPGRVQSHVLEDSSEESNDEGVLIEEVSKTLKDQRKQGKSIEIRNLRKTFGEKTAVDDLSLSIYSGQITALLGHNGAGMCSVFALEYIWFT